MEILHFAVLLAVLVNANGEVPVTVGKASVEVREGEAAELSCTTTSEILFCTFIDPAGESLNMLPSLDYEEGRITFQGLDPKKDCGLKINKVVEKDNGEWRCRITAVMEGSSSAKKGEQSALVTVVKPPTSVSITSEENTLSTTYPEDTTREVRCMADGGRPAPTFSWMLGKKAYQGPVVNEEGAQVITYKAIPEHNGKTLSCVVAHKGYSQAALDTGENKDSVALDVRFKPVAANKDSPFYGMKLGKPYTIIMSFKSHPAPLDVHWEMHDRTIVAQDSENKRYRAARLETDSPHPGHFTASITIDKVLLEDQDSENKLVVKNELGETEYRFSLGLGEKPPAEAGTGPVVAIVIVVVIILILIAVAIVSRSQGLLCFADPPKVDEDKEKAVSKEEGSDTESAEAKVEDEKDAETGKTEPTDANNEEEPVINNNKKSVSARFTGLLCAMKKTVSKKEKYGETESEVKVPVSIILMG